MKEQAGYKSGGKTDDSWDKLEAAARRRNYRDGEGKASSQELPFHLF